MSDKHKLFIEKAISLSMENVGKGGGPFGAVIVKNNKIIAEGVNTVTLSNDPTAHAEINAIRNASRKLNTFDLSGCIIYSSCEPCPMCLASIYWARLEKIFFANTKTDAKLIGFNDSFIYEQLARPVLERTIPAIRLHDKKAIEAFQKWNLKEDKTLY